MWFIRAVEESDIINHRASIATLLFSPVGFARACCKVLRPSDFVAIDHACFSQMRSQAKEFLWLLT